jgi:hypothetical protein
MGSPLDGHEECISSWKYLKGYLYGATPQIFAVFIFGMSTEEVSLWPQEGPEGMVFQYGLLLVVTELYTL